MRLDARWRKRRVVRFEEHHADDVVPDVPLFLQLQIRLKEVMNAREGNSLVQFVNEGNG